MISLDIVKRLSSFVLKIAFDIKDGEFISISGRSGAGKTTLLRILAGLESSDSKIIVDSRIWQDRDIFLPPQKREIGFVFQDFALFENMSVIQNLLFVKRDKKLATYLLDLSELSHLKDIYPTRLSGGEKQRVALCRALMKRPKLLLMDEPLSALDRDIKSKLREEIVRIKEEFDLSVVMVSHDLSEIYKMSDRVIYIDKGEIKKVEKRGDFPSAKITDLREVDTKLIAKIDLFGEVIEVELDRSNSNNPINLL